MFNFDSNHQLVIYLPQHLASFYQFMAEHRNLKAAFGNVKTADYDTEFKKMIDELKKNRKPELALNLPSHGWSLPEPFYTDAEIHRLIKSYPEIPLKGERYIKLYDLSRSIYHDRKFDAEALKWLKSQIDQLFAEFESSVKLPTIEAIKTRLQDGINAYHQPLTFDDGTDAEIGGCYTIYATLCLILFKQLIKVVQEA